MNKPEEHLRIIVLPELALIGIQVAKKKGASEAKSSPR
jgi:hypothetical protein